MADTYYRLHRMDLPKFCAENAYSGTWGQTFSPDGSQMECLLCNGTGVDEFEGMCSCDNGWLDCDNGYSCCYSAEDLIAYFAKHCPADAEDPIVVFEGERVGNGDDGEPLVVPTTIIRWTTIGQLAGRLS